MRAIIACVMCLAGLIVVPASAEDAAVPAGQTLRIYMIGNSLTDNVWYDGFKSLAESQGYKHVWGRTMIPGSPIFWHWGHEGGFTQPPFGAWGKALREYEWDAITLQPFSGYRQEMEAALNFVDLAVKKSPQAQFYIYAQWPGKGRGDWDALFSAALPEDRSKWTSSTSVRQYYERFVPEIRKARPGIKPPRLIPAGHSMYLLSQKIKAGQAPGLKSILDLYNDGIHLNNIGAYNAGLSFYATIYGRSPIGLPLEPYQVQEGHKGIKLTPELAKIIQETVWETVTSNPLTGVTSDQPVKVVSPILAEGVAGKKYEMMLLAAYGQYPYAWSLASGTLPDGLQLSKEGVILGTPASAGEAKFTVKVTDAKNASATGELSLRIVADSKPQIADEKLPPAQQGKYYRHTLKATGGNGTLTWRPASKAVLPAGLSLDADGSLWGSPAVTGRFTFAVEVVDADLSSADRASRNVSIEIAPADKDVLFVRQVAPKTITVDGKLDEAAWNFDQKIDKLVGGAKTGVEAAFDVVTDNDTLYIAVKVKDPKVAENPKELSSGDSVEVFLDLLNNRESTYNFDDRRFVISPTGKLFVVGNQVMVKAAAQKTTDGYSVEISMHNYGLGIRLSHCAIGLDVAVNDSADGKTRNGRLVWRGTKDNETDPSGFATAIIPERKAK